MGNNPAPISQLDGSTGARMNCIPASIVWVGRDLVGDAWWSTITAQGLRDLAYPGGSDETGPTSARDFVAVCAAHGLQLTPYDSPDQQTLVNDLHADLASDCDALVTMPSEWGIIYPYSQLENPPWSTHVAAAAYNIAGGLRLMNPWGGFWQDVTDEWLIQHLTFGEIWKAAAAVAAPAPTPAPGSNQTVWHIAADGTANDDAGHHVGEGVAALIQSHGLMGVDALTNETYYAGQDGDNSATPFANGVVAHYDKAANATDLNGAVVVRDLLSIKDQQAQQIAELQAQVSGLQQQLAQAQQTAQSEEASEAAQPAPAPDPVAEAAKAAIAQLKSVLAAV